MLLAFSSYTLVPTSTSTSASTDGIIGGAVGGPVALLIVLCIIIWCVVHCYKKRSSYGKGHITLSPISFHNSKATNHYASNVYELTNMTSSITGINSVDARTCK